MFVINWTEKSLSIHLLNVRNIWHRVILSFKPMPHTPSNDYYSFDMLRIRNIQRKEDLLSLSLLFFRWIYFRITKSDLIPRAQTIFDHLFRILTSEKSYENEYVMRAVMRLSSSLHEGVLPYLNQLMEKLVMILKRSSRVCLFFSPSRNANSFFFHSESQ